MTYKRVIPRDLFNEASLLKMLGVLYLRTEGDERVELRHLDVAHPEFVIEQDQADGSISVFNIRLFINGWHCPLYRPLNSRDSWPLWLKSPHDPNFEDIKVFAEDIGEYLADEDKGQLSEEFRRLVDETVGI